MKKFIVIIIILVIILFGMIIHKNISIKSEVGMQEVEKIENYINQIYLEKEIVGDSIPCFENINEANEKWIWEVVKKNIEEDKITYEKLQEKVKEIYGEDLKKEFPKEGKDYLKYNEEENIYEAIQSETDEQGSLYLINEIKKVQEGYEIKLIEYLEDYSSEDYIVIKNLKGEEISRTTTTTGEEGIDIVKRNIDRFSTKKILLKLKDEKLYIQKVDG